MSERPLISNSFEELSSYFNRNRDNMTALKKLEHELHFRHRNKNVPYLRGEVSAAIEEASQASATDCPRIEDEKTRLAFRVSGDWDKAQREIIELEESESLIVEAGPGTGKTAVACARVAYLVEEYDLESSKILLVSFTRTAVRELRNRIEYFADDPRNVSGVRICTLDSFTWQALRGVNDDKAELKNGSYDGSIRALVEQLNKGNNVLLDYMEEIEHLILDEGQDLVGDRAELTLSLIETLDSECGVTVFADSAQAIYGFTSDDNDRQKSQAATVVERLRDQYDQIILKQVHRTSDPNLTRLFLEGRNLLLNRSESDIEGWKAIKDLIIECSHGTCKPPQQETLTDGQLVLYRTRAEVLNASSYLWNADTPHCLRMSGVAQRVHPWIGRLFGNYDDTTVDLDDFMELWQNEIGDSAEDADSAWDLLVDQISAKNGDMRIVRLRELLARDRPPIDFLVDESDLEGPIIGTIHASKGREANRVNLMLPPDSYINADPDSDFCMSAATIAEEERVLFVGATRAKTQLLTGKGNRFFASRTDRTGRVYSRTRKGGYRIEFGLHGDIDIASLADERLGNDSENMQNWLWQNRTSVVELTLRYDRELEASMLCVTEDELPICLVSDQLTADLWTIARKAGDSKRPPAFINHIRMTGATTVVVPEALRETLKTPWRHSGFLLAPVISGFPTLYLKHWNKRQ